jgi:formylglycine-generating enzyme required for sulfatase activity
MRWQLALRSLLSESIPRRKLAAYALIALSACGAHHEGGDAAAPKSTTASPITPEAPSPDAAASATASSSAPSDAGVDAGPPAWADGMLRVPGGHFKMGADEGGELDEHPAHDVTLASFWLDATEVTNAAYEECVAKNVCRPHDPSNASHHRLDDKAFRGPKQPISGISWDDAVKYCGFRDKRLPTEAEWERAARGDDGRRYPWGDSPPSPERAIFGTKVTGDVASHPKGAGPYGHLDLAGNVWEWMADEYDPRAYRRPSASAGKPGTCDEIMATLAELRKTGQRGFTGSNPIPTECEHVLRGGAFNYDAQGLRTTNRVHHPGRFRLVMSGFRCAHDD